MASSPLMRPDLLPVILETLDAIVVVLDPEGRIVVLNGGAEQVSGYTSEEVEGRRFWEVFTPDGEAPDARGIFERILAGHDLDGHEHDWVDADGVCRTISWRTRALEGSGGEAGLIVATGLDVTALRGAENHAASFAAEGLAQDARIEALEASERKLSGIVSLAPDAIIFTDAKQTITLFNEGAERIFGHTASEVVGRPLGVLLPERFRTIHREHVVGVGQSPVQARKMGERHEISGLRKDGVEFPAEASIVKLDLSGERIYAVLLRDVSERVRAQETQRFLAEVGEVLASSLDYDETLRSVARLSVRSLADFCIIDRVKDDGSIERVEVAHRDPARSDAAEALLRFPLDRRRRHLMGRVLVGGEPEVYEDVSDEHLASLAQGAEHRSLLQALECRSYMVIPLQVRNRLTGAVLLGSTEPGRRYGEDDLALAIDLARRAALAMDNARLYRDIKKALRGRDEVLGAVSHDLGNPLQAIAIAAQALEKSVAETDTKGRYYLDALARSVELMERLIRDLLEVRRMEAGFLSMDRACHSIEPLVTAALEVLEPLAAVKSIRLVAEPPAGGLRPVDVDPDRVVQVLSNLVGNAVKHTPGGGEVAVRIRPEVEEILVSVEDTGPGIPEEDLSLIFQPFWRARKSPGGGIGLGLSIAREIVHSHGGRIWAESELGRGSAFHFTLPYHTAPGEDGE